MGTSLGTTPLDPVRGASRAPALSSRTSRARGAPRAPHDRDRPGQRALAAIARALPVALLAAACSREFHLPDSHGEPRILGHMARGSERPEGTWTWSYPDGALREQGSFEDGLRAGTWIQWWSNGKKRSEGRRVPDPATRTSPREGPWTFWHPNGAVAAHGIYRAGRREGAWEYSLDDGRLDGDRSGLYHLDLLVTDR